MRMLLQAVGILALLFVMHSCGDGFTQPIPRDRAMRATAKAQIASFAQALEMYRKDVGSFPTTSQGLEALLSCPARLANPRRWKGPYLMDCSVVPRDPWGNAYFFEGDEAGKECTILSVGPDGRNDERRAAEELTTTLTVTH